MGDPWVVNGLVRGIVFGRYFIVLGWIAISIGCVFPAMELNDYVSQDINPPPDTQSYRAREFLKEHFPTLAYGSGFALLATSTLGGLDLGTDPNYFNFDKAMEYACAGETLDFDRVNIPTWNTTANATLQAGWGSFRSTTEFGFPELVAKQYLGPGNRSTFALISFSSTYNTDETKSYDKFFSVAIANLTADYNLTGRVEVSVFGLPTFLREITDSTSEDLQVVFFIVLPLALAVFGFSLSSARLLVFPIATMAVSYCFSVAIFTGIAKVYPVNSMAPGIAVFVLLVFSLNYTYFLMSQYRRMVKVNRAEACDASLAVSHLMSHAGRAIFITGICTSFCGAGVCGFQAEVLRSFGMAIIVVSMGTLLVALTLVPALLAISPAFFAGSADAWINAVRPEDIADPSGTDEVGVKMNVHSLSENDDALPFHERWHLNVINFVSQSPNRYIIMFFVLFVAAVPMSFAGDGVSSNSLTQFMPRSSPLLPRWNALQEYFRAGEVFSYYLLIDSNEDLGEDYYANTQDMIQIMSERLPATSIANFDGITVSGVMNQNFTSSDLFPCFGDPNTPFCRYRLLCAFVLFLGTNTTSYFLVRLGFDPTSPLGADWYREATVLLPELEAKYNYSLYLDGYGGLTYDTVKLADDALPTIAGLTAAIVFVTITLAFGSLVIPLKVVATCSLTVATTYGLANIVYVRNFLSRLKLDCFDGSNHSIAWQIPLACFNIVAGLALSYDLLILVKILEQRWQGIDSQVAVIRGAAAVGREISVSALITIIVFSGLLVSEIPAINQMAFYFVVAAASQAFVYRLFFTPAVMSTLGQWNWWPMQLLSEYLTPPVVAPSDEPPPTLIDAEDYRRSIRRIAERRSMLGTYGTSGENREDSSVALIGAHPEHPPKSHARLSDR